jgi:hypothetical protein
MRKYSIFCDDTEGYPQDSEVRSFSGNGSARRYVQRMATGAGRVEVWCEGNLIYRLYRYDRPSLAEKAEAAVRARRTFLNGDRIRSDAQFDFLKSDTLSWVKPLNIGNSLGSEQGQAASPFPSYLPSSWPPLQPTVPQQ